MNSTFKLAILAALGVAGPFLAQQSSALDAAQPSDSDALETIVVTAEKREESLKDVPMSVTALSGGSLDKLMDRSFSDYAAMVPGLSLVSSQPGLTRLTCAARTPAVSGRPWRFTWTNRRSARATPCSTAPSSAAISTPGTCSASRFCAGLRHVIWRQQRRRSP